MKSQSISEEVIFSANNRFYDKKKNQHFYNRTFVNNFKFLQ